MYSLNSRNYLALRTEELSRIYPKRNLWNSVFAYFICNALERQYLLEYFNGSFNNIWIICIGLISFCCLFYSFLHFSIPKSVIFGTWTSDKSVLMNTMNWATTCRLRTMKKKIKIYQAVSPVYLADLVKCIVFFCRCYSSFWFSVSFNQMYRYDACIGIRLLMRKTNRNMFLLFYFVFAKYFFLDFAIAFVLSFIFFMSTLEMFISDSIVGAIVWFYICLVCTLLTLDCFQPDFLFYIRIIWCGVYSSSKNFFLYFFSLPKLTFTVLFSCIML